MNLQKRFEIIWAALKVGMTVKSFRQMMRRKRLIEKVASQVRDFKLYWIPHSWKEEVKWCRNNGEWYKTLLRFSGIEAAEEYRLSREAHWGKLTAIHSRYW